MENRGCYGLGKVLILVLGVIFAGSASARNFEFKGLGSNGALTGGNAGIRSSWESGSSSMTTAQSFAIRVGSALKTDCMDKMEIRAATLMRSMSNKTIVINDIATLVFEPINQGKSINFMVVTGSAKKSSYNGRSYSGWQVVGCIIEFWQKGKLIKHWTNCAGMAGKTRLTQDVEQKRLGKDGYSNSFSDDNFDNVTSIFPITAKGERVSLDELLGEFREDKDQLDQGKSKKFDGDPESFKLSSFCGFEFGQKRPELEPRIVKLAKPFLHYTLAVPYYDGKDDKLVAITLRTQKYFSSQLAREMAGSDVALAFEKEYGIRLKENFGDFNFSNSHVSIRVTSRDIEIRNYDVQNDGQGRKSLDGTAMGGRGARQMKYLVKKSDQVTAADRRIVFEDLREPVSFESNYGNIAVRRFSSPQDADDFKLVNPKGIVFDTLAELKAFMRTVEIVDEANGEEVRPLRRRRRMQPPAGQEEPVQQPVQEEPMTNRVTVADPDSVKRPAPRRELSDEERLLIELKHDEEMLKRKIKLQKDGQPR